TRPATFVVGGLAYSWVAGMAFAAFTGFVLEVIGAGAAATKYNIFAALSNAPITYMGLVLAWSVAWFKPGGMLLTEAGGELAGVAILTVAAYALGFGVLRGGSAAGSAAAPAALEPDQAVEG